MPLLVLQKRTADYFFPSNLHTPLISQSLIPTWNYTSLLNHCCQGPPSTLAMVSRAADGQGVTANHLDSWKTVFPRAKQQTWGWQGTSIWQPWTLPAHFVLFFGGLGEYVRLIFFSGTGDFIFSPAWTLGGCSQWSSRSAVWSEPCILHQIAWPWGGWGFFLFHSGKMALHITRVSLQDWAGCMCYVSEAGAEVPWYRPMTSSQAHSIFPLSYVVIWTP